MKRIGMIGCGLIGTPVIQAVQSGQLGDWTIAAILSRKQRTFGSLRSIVKGEEFFEQQFDLTIDTAKPAGIQTHGIRALSVADLWTVNASVLSNAEFYKRLEEAGRQNGHRLRILSGAIAGLDGVATACVDGDAEVTATIDLAPSEKPRATLLKGSAREAAEQFPESVNVALAAAIAGPGVDRMQVEVVRPNIVEGRKLVLCAESRYGQFNTVAVPRVVAHKIHTVSASIIAALRREDEVIWVG